MARFKNFIYQYLPYNIIRILKKIHYYHKLKNAAETSEEDLPIIKELVKNGDDVIDIGANFGLYSKFMSHSAGNQGRVFSIEPVPETYDYLANNIRKLKLSNTLPLNFAISDEKGKATMEVPKFIHTGDNFYEARIVDKVDDHLKTFEVQTTTLTDLLQEFNIRPSFIKCDVEGHEWQVFKNAEGFLRQFSPVLLIEINQDLSIADDNTRKLLNLLNSSGYSIYISSGKNLKKWNGEKKYNYYFLMEEHAKKLTKESEQ